MAVPIQSVLAAVLIAALHTLVSPGVRAAEPAVGYALGLGDKVRITVFGEPELSVSAWVGDQGTIPYPLIGELPVRGLRLPEVERLVVARLKGPYLVDPQVTVSVDEYRPFFVLGQVNRPGGYPYAPGLTVRKAVSFAGGFTDRASRGKIFLTSEDAPQDERRVEETDPVGPSDTVIVKGSFF